MNTNLDTIAQDLYGKISVRFDDIKMGDEHGEVLSRKTDIPKARFFEFEYRDNGDDLGTITITLDQDDGVIVQVSGKLEDSRHKGAFKFIRGLRTFAKDRLLNFNLQNIGKDHLDKRDYEFQAKPKEEIMPAMMESKLYGTAKISYQDLGEARLIIKHSEPVNTDIAAGRTMHIESIYIENAEGERFKYPVKHLNGARALAEHLKHGGIPYDSIGKHIVSLSEELAQLRKFKGYVGRNESLAEAMGDITSKVMERIEEVKKEVNMLQRSSYYEQFAESFEDKEEQMIPEEIMSDWIDRLTIRTFNEDLKTAFPYIFKLVDESEIPVKELSPDDLIGEVFDGDKETGTTHKGGKVEKTKHGVKHTKTDYDDGGKDWERKEPKSRWKHDAILDKEDDLDEVMAFEEFMNSLMNEDNADIGANDKEWGEGIFSADPKDAIKELNDLFSKDLTPGVGGANLDILKKLIPDPEFIAKIDEISNVTSDSSDEPVNQAIKVAMHEVGETNHNLAKILNLGLINFDGTGEVGGEEEPPEADASATPPAPEATPPAPDMGAGAPPPEAGAEAGAVPPGPEETPTPPPMAEDAELSRWLKIAGLNEGYNGSSAVSQPAPGNPVPSSNVQATQLPPAGGAAQKANPRLIKAIHKAIECGAGPDTMLDFGHKAQTLLSCIEECGMEPQSFGFESDGGQEESGEDGLHQMLKDISGFWNHEKKNFTIGGTRAKIKVMKSFKDGEYPNATEDDLREVMKMIEKVDPTSSHHSTEHAVDEEGNDQAVDFNTIMQQFQAMQQHPEQFGQQMQQRIGSELQKAQQSGQIPNQNIQFPGGQMNPADMMKQLMQKINFGN